MAGQQAGDAGLGPRIADVVDADVDGQFQGLARALPRCALRDGVIERPARQPPYESGLLGEWDEIRGAEQSPRRLLPAQPDLRARHAAGPELDLGLEEQAQLGVV